jgi:glutamate---cysteine ligase / carboxylate-amine ligase
VSRPAESSPYDEAYDERGDPRPQYAELLGALADPGPVAAEARRGLGERGVTFGGGGSADTPLFDPVPRILTAAESSDLETGIAQRLRALETFINDGRDRPRRGGVLAALRTPDARRRARTLDQLRRP